MQLNYVLDVPKLLSLNIKSHKLSVCEQCVCICAHLGVCNVSPERYFKQSEYYYCRIKWTEGFRVLVTVWLFVTHLKQWQQLVNGATRRLIAIKILCCNVKSSGYKRIRDIHQQRGAVEPKSETNDLINALPLATCKVLS